MNRLFLNQVYLCGPIDAAKDKGRTWREEIIPFLVERGVIIRDPQPFDSRMMEYVRELKEYGRFEEIREHCEPALRDLRMVDKADFLICHLDNTVPTCGTWEEIFWANRMKLPIIIHMEQGKASTPGWLLFRLPSPVIFSTWDEVREYIRHVDEDESIDTLNGRWKFFPDLIEKYKEAFRTKGYTVTKEKVYRASSGY